MIKPNFKPSGRLKKACKTTSNCAILIFVSAKKANAGHLLQNLPGKTYLLMNVAKKDAQFWRMTISYQPDASIKLTELKEQL